jgi:hypothetical protein
VTDEDLLTVAKDFYGDCMFANDSSETNYTKLGSLIEDALLEFPTNETDLRSLFAFLGRLRRDIGANYIFSLKVDSDIHNREKNALYVSHSRINNVPSLQCPSTQHSTF